MPARLAVRVLPKGVYLKGAIVAAAPANSEFGAKVTLPGWGTLTITDINYKEAAQHAEGVFKAPLIVAELSDPPAGDYRLKFYSRKPGTYSGIDRIDVETLITDWAGTYVSHGAGEVLFDINMVTSAASAGAWRQNWDAGIVFASQGIDGSGVLTMTADYSSTAVDSNQIAHEATTNGFDVIDNAAGVLTFIVEPADLRDAMRRQAMELVDTSQLGPRYYLNDAYVDQLVAGGGNATITKAQLLAALNDRNG